MKHTQGKWYVSDIPQEGGCYIYTDNNRFSAIARVYKGNNPHAAEAEANARLIAAAPDLLEALDTAVQYIDAKRYPELMQMCEAAISKAKGE